MRAHAESIACHSNSPGKSATFAVRCSSSHLSHAARPKLHVVTLAARLRLHCSVWLLTLCVLCDPQRPPLSCSAVQKQCPSCGLSKRTSSFARHATCNHGRCTGPVAASAAANTAVVSRKRKRVDEEQHEARRSLIQQLSSRPRSLQPWEQLSSSSERWERLQLLRLCCVALGMPTAVVQPKLRRNAAAAVARRTCRAVRSASWTSSPRRRRLLWLASPSSASACSRCSRCSALRCAAGRLVCRWCSRSARSLAAGRAVQRGGAARPATHRHASSSSYLPSGPKG
jgi:hypothetical protein